MPRIRDLHHEVEHFVTTQKTAYPLSEQMRVLFFRLRFVPDQDYEGTIDDVRNFVTWFKKIIRAENKDEARKQDRLEALAIIERELLSGPFPSAFSYVDLPKFIFQLVLRVREPKLIDQASTYLCGIVPLIFRMAKVRLRQYVELAISLIMHGTARIDRIDIEPPRHIWQASPMNGLGECDYVVLASVRSSALIFNTSSWGTSISDLSKYLRYAGYVEIENHIVFRGNKELERYYPEGFTVERLLEKMVEKVALRRNVIMVEDTQIATALTSGKPIATGFLGIHFSYVTRFKVNFQTRTVDLKAYNWGGSRERKAIRIADFEPHFGGFISCAEGPRWSRF